MKKIKIELIVNDDIREKDIDTMLEIGLKHMMIDAKFTWIDIIELQE